jgi:hypothetical protein
MSLLPPFCERTGERHGNALSCGICFTTVSRTHTESRTEPIPAEIEVLDLTTSSTPSSPSPQKATHVFAAPSRERFSHYDRTGGAEDHRQASMTRTRNLPLMKATRTPLQFFLLKEIQTDGVPQPLSCQLLCIFKLNSY